MFLFPRHQLCVKQDFQFAILHPIICFLGWFIWSKSSLLSLPSLIFRLPYTIKRNCHHPIPHHFLFMTIPSCEFPFRLCVANQFLCSCLFCARIKALSSLILSISFYLPYVPSNSFLYSSPWGHFKVFSF